MQKQIILLLILFLVPTSFAFDCSILFPQTQMLCNQLQALNLSSLEKDIISSNLGCNTTFYPNHNFIYNHNHNILVIEPPLNATKQNGIYSGKNPKSILASTLYIAAKRQNENVSQRRIANIVGVTEVAIRKTCKEIEMEA